MARQTQQQKRREIAQLEIKLSVAKHNCNSYSARFSRTGNPQDQTRYYYFADEAYKYLTQLNKLKRTITWH
ncbi:hypothetical protein [Actinobacillus lignieresii]|uniref:hypothetical protein n=1 Tax=Actinobacillus lignieresii TaxID=720 RepID=UPI000E2063BA|nr:hypothetical protein [Actinobacillus lignieresii]